MSNIIIPKGWEIPESQVTPKSTYVNRRELIRALGLGTISGMAAPLVGCGLTVEGFEEFEAQPVTSLGEILPAPVNDLYQVPERPLTPLADATVYNNYYEFTTNKPQVHRLVGGFEVEPWTVEIGGLCHNPGPLDFQQIINQFTFQERIYRHRCVERWAMTVPWTGFPLSELIALADPMGSARYVRMFTETRPSVQPGLEDRPGYPWPYHEALRLDEAMNDLAFMVVGLYGEPVPVQNGAPLRLVTPWKYGYKSIKAISRIEFVEEKPSTFWNTINDNEYGFYSNVNPEVPHPRWSQAEEWLIPDTGNTRATMLYNGYADLVGDLYDGTES
ncbi:MAG: sulfoxide reductase catalytic subunit YedY [Bradymonadia bacterium]|jgi:sulfoxide reductase catalytic subunit YedY